MHRWLCVLFVTSVAFSGCKKSTAKFKPGDRVVERLEPSKKGIVYLRFNTDKPYYYLKVPGKPQRAPEFLAWWDDSDKDNLQVHIEGPFGDEDLELAR